MSLRDYSSLLLITVVFCFPTELQAQQNQDSATLFSWEQRIQNFMLDRSHNYGGTHFKRGLFREHLNTMSPEHEIDLLTYRYTLVDDYNWIQADRAYQLGMGSLNATDFATENRIKSNISLNSKNKLKIKGYHEENLRTNRFLFHLGYEHTFDGRHTVGGRHTLTNKKGDLDATIYYRYGSFEEGLVQLDFTLLDWASDVVQGLAEESSNEYNELYEVTHQYRHKPYLFSLKAVSPEINNFRAELVSGLQTYSEKLVEPLNDTTDFVDEEWAHYLGGLLEYSNRFFTAGLTYQRTFSKLKRMPAPGSSYEDDFGNWQISDAAGFFAIGRIKSFRLEQWLWHEWNTDRLQGENVPGDLTPLDFQNNRIPFDFEESRVKLKSRLLYDPVSGITAGFEFHADYRHPQGERAENGVRNFDFRRVYPVVRNRNERLTLTLGYRFNENFYFLAGVSYDLDQDKQSGIGLPRITGTPTWFDGGFGRLSIRW